MLAAFKAFCELLGPHSLLPHKLLVLDSTPGGHRFSQELVRWSKGLSAGIGPYLPWPQQVTLALAIGFITVTLGIPTLFGIENIGTRSRRLLNDPNLTFPGAHRLYIYSEKDEIIGWRELEEHAAEAVAKGWRVRLQRFHDTAHVGHMREHPEEYWNSIVTAWEAASGSQ